MKKQAMFQQGDCLCIRAELPAKLKPVKPGQRGFILAEGEHTGHAHCIEECPDVEMFEDEKGTLYLSVKTPVAIKHEEHKPQTITPGTYRVGRVVEVDPFSEEVRQVMD